MKYLIEVEATATICEIWRTADRETPPTFEEAGELVSAADVEFVSDSVTGDETDRMVLMVTPESEPPAPTSAGPKVYVLIEERNVTDRPIDGSADAWVDSVYASRAAADVAQIAAIDEAIEEGKAVYHDPRQPDASNDAAWDVDFKIEEHDVTA